jgi:hypothetical protein
MKEYVNEIRLSRELAQLLADHRDEETRLSPKVFEKLCELMDEYERQKEEGVQ